MRHRIGQILVPFAGLGLAALGIAFVGAQSGTESAELAASQRAQLGSAEQIEEAENIVSRGQTVCERLSTMTTNAQREGDIVLLDCLTPLNAQCSANTTTASERIGFLRNAIADRDTAAASHEYTMLVLLEDKFDLLEVEGNQCLGEDDFEVGDERLTVVPPEDLPPDDPAMLPGEPPGVDVPFIPPPASATM